MKKKEKYHCKKFQDARYNLQAASSHSCASNSMCNVHCAFLLFQTIKQTLFLENPIKYFIFIIYNDSFA